jgi:hypothetical protein
MSFSGTALSSRQTPLNIVIGKFVIVDQASMIENSRVGFSLGDAQTPTDHLPIQPKGLGRSQQQDSIDRWQIKTFGENLSIGQYANFAGGKIGNGLITLLLRGFPVDMLCWNPRRFEASRQLAAGVDRYAKGKGPCVWCQPFLEVIDDIANESALVHRRFEVVAIVLFLFHANAPQVGDSRCEILEL